MNTNAYIIRSWNLLRFSYALVLLLAGLDKLLGTNLIVFWPQYISPFVGNHLPVSTVIFLGTMGIVEIAVALMLATRWARIGGYLSVLWLVLISINLLMLHFIDIAVRDLLLAVGAFVIADLSTVVEQFSPKGRGMSQ